MLFHFQSKMNFRIVIKSAVLLFITLGIAGILSLLSDTSFNWKIIMISFPFFVHVVISIFVKEKESWLLGAIVSTLIAMVFVVGFIIILG